MDTLYNIKKNEPLNIGSMVIEANQKISKT